MKFTKLLQAILLVAFATLGIVAHAQGVAPAKSRVVFQVSDGDAAKWGLALNNASNVQQELGADKVDVEIVAYGPGIGMLKADSIAANRITEAVQGGVRVVACENTMKAQKLVKSDMNGSVGFVPAGVVEIMKRQAEGWAYIRP
jgi:intracellular sulfur oxidation DsrE/DsrF family protein